MSWSFSVAGSKPDEAEKAFKRELHKAASNVPVEITDKLNGSARWLAYNAPDNCSITLSSSGHINDDGSGYRPDRLRVQALRSGGRRCAGRRRRRARERHREDRRRRPAGTDVDDLPRLDRVTKNPHSDVGVFLFAAMPSRRLPCCALAGD